jgi:hypothetical protein
MTTIKTWQERTEFNGPCYPPEAQEEITDLRAAVERKDALLRECLTVIWFDADGSKVRVQITKELE